MRSPRQYTAGYRSQEKPDFVSNIVIFTTVKIDNLPCRAEISASQISNAHN
jgi:hypothetical protein